MVLQSRTSSDIDSGETSIVNIHRCQTGTLCKGRRFPLPLWQPERPISSLRESLFRLSRRLVIPFLKAHGLKRYPRTSSAMVFRIGPKLAMKLDCWGQFTEANTMQFVRERTTIPVPAILDAWKLRGVSVLLMEWIADGQPLRDMWAGLVDEQKQEIAVTIRGYVDQLRAIRPPENVCIGAINQGRLFHDAVLSRLCGPFASEQDFNDFLVSRVEPLATVPTAQEQLEWLRRHMRNDHRIYFTHGDLNSKNILVNKKGQVIAIVDWRMSGWLPEYWEYITCADGGFEMDDWPNYAKSLTYPDDLQLEVHDMFLKMHGIGPWC